MVLHPDVQSRAQTEVDNVVGKGQLPNFGDEMSLPYVSALVEEVIRWHPIAPVGEHYPRIPPQCKETYFCTSSGSSSPDFLRQAVS